MSGRYLRWTPLTCWWCGYVPETPFDDHRLWCGSRPRDCITTDPSPSQEVQP